MIDRTKCSAILYSTSELQTYNVEIYDTDKQFFISKENLPISFASLETAKAAARNAGAIVGFLALDKTYEEVDFVNDHDGKAEGPHHELLPISLL